MTTRQLYRVQKAASGVRENLTGAMSLGSAIAHLNSITTNMEANGWLKTDRTLMRKLPITLLAKDLRTVALSVVECGETEITGTQVELRDMPWLVRSVPVNGIEPTQDYTVDSDRTPTDNIFALKEGSDDAQQESAGV